GAQLGLKHANLFDHRLGGGIERFQRDPVATGERLDPHPGARARERLRDLLLQLRYWYAAPGQRVLFLTPAGKPEAAFVQPLEERVSVVDQQGPRDSGQVGLDRRIGAELAEPVARERIGFDAVAR